MRWEMPITVRPAKTSAKLCGVEPRADLPEATLRTIRNRGTVTLTRDLKSLET